MEAPGQTEIVSQSPSDESDSDDELFEYLNMSKKTEKQAKKVCKKDDHEEKKEEITNSKTVNLNLKKGQTKVSSKVQEVSSMSSMAGSTESAGTEVSVKTVLSHHQEHQTPLPRDESPSDDKRQNSSLSSKLTFTYLESKRDNEILMKQENSCLSDGYISGNTEKGMAESKESEESSSNSTSELNLKAAPTELDNYSVHLSKEPYTYGGDKETDEKRNEAFIPEISKIPLPTQYKFVRNGNKLVRVAVIQEDISDPDIVYDGVYDHQQTSKNNVEPTEDEQTHELYTAVVADINFDNSYDESVDDDSGFETGGCLYETARTDELYVQTESGDISTAQEDKCHLGSTETHIMEKTCNSLIMENTIDVNEVNLMDNKKDIVKKTDSDFVEYLENACYSENASTSSQISLCSNESRIVLKVDPDGNLSECTKCPASIGITTQILKEKKTEMDISYLSMKIQKIENDILEMKRVAEKSNEMKDFSQVIDQSEENVNKVKMKDVNSQTEVVEMKSVVNDMAKTVEANKHNVSLKETTVDTCTDIGVKVVKNGINHGQEKELNAEVATNTCINDNERDRGRKCGQQEEKAVRSNISVDNETKTIRKSKPKKAITRHTSHNKCVEFDKRKTSKKGKQEKERALDCTTSFCSDTVDDNETLKERKHKPQKEMGESISQNAINSMIKIVEGGRVKKRKQPTGSLDVHPVKKQKHTSLLSSHELFEETESNDVASPKSSRGNKSSDEESQNDTDDYMIYNEEYLQKLYRQKLNEVRHIQNALKRMHQKSLCSNDMQSKDKMVNKFCTEESMTEGGLDIESAEKEFIVKKDGIGKICHCSKSNCCKKIGCNMSNVTEIPLPNMSTELTSSANLSTKSRPPSKSVRKTRKSRGTKRVTWSEKSNRTLDASPAVPPNDKTIDSTNNSTHLSIPASTEKLVRAKRSCKKSATGQLEESVVSEMKDDPLCEVEHLSVCTADKTPSRHNEIGDTPDVLKQNRKRKVETSYKNTRKSLQVKRKDGQIAKEGINTNDIVKEGNEKEINQFDVAAKKYFLKSDPSSSNSENIEQKRSRLESIISEKLKASKDNGNVSSSQQKMDNQVQELTKNKPFTCTNRKISRKKTDRNINELKIKRKPQLKVSARKSRLRTGCAAKKSNLNKDTKGQESDTGVNDTRKKKNADRQSAKNRKRAAGLIHSGRLAFEKSCDYTWKEKLDSDSFSLNLETRQDRAKRPLNVKKIIRKILVPEDLSGKKSNSTKKSKQFKRHKVAKSEMTAIVQGSFSDSDDACQSDTAYLSDNNVSVSSFPGMKLCEEHSSPEMLTLKKEGSIDLSMRGDKEEVLVQKNEELSTMGDNKRTSINLGDTVSVGNTENVNVSQSSFGDNNQADFDTTIFEKSEKTCEAGLITVQKDKNLCVEIHDSPSETEEVEIETCLSSGKSSNNGKTSKKKVDTDTIPKSLPASPRYMKTFDQIRSLLDRRRKTCTGSTAQQQLDFKEEL